MKLVTIANACVVGVGVAVGVTLEVAIGVCAVTGLANIPTVGVAVGVAVALTLEVGVGVPVVTGTVDRPPVEVEEKSDLPHEDVTIAMVAKKKTGKLAGIVRSLR